MFFILLLLAVVSAVAFAIVRAAWLETAARREARREADCVQGKPWTPDGR